MFRISSSTKIFVPCPAGAVTGGAELLHQIVDIINSHGREAFIVYLGDQPHDIPSDYQKYNIKIANKVVDDPDNIAVIYEGIFALALKIHKAQLMLWWLSVDNYFLCNRHTLIEKLRYQISFPVKYTIRRIIGETIINCLNPSNVVSLPKLRKLNVACNGYQSEYAREFLQKNGFKNLHSLKDYINDDNFEGNCPNAKENIVIYNPKKGIKFTTKLIDYAPDIRWVPIQGLNRSGVISLMRRAKVYIDFGNHPGKDRLPREAAINGCCIVTGKQGSAGYKDVDIPYKFNQTTSDVPAIISILREILNDYNKYTSEFDHYRDLIRGEKSDFYRDCIDIFQLED